MVRWKSTCKSAFCQLFTTGAGLMKLSWTVVKKNKKNQQKNLTF